jgi:hypothetical protein
VKDRMSLVIHLQDVYSRKFVILATEDDENNPVIGISATAVWTIVVKRVGALRLEEGGKKSFANVSGTASLF